MKANIEAHGYPVRADEPRRRDDDPGDDGLPPPRPSTTDARHDRDRLVDAWLAGGAP